MKATIYIFVFLFLKSLFSFGQTTPMPPAKMDSSVLRLLWETEAVLNVPESVLYDAENHQLLVSNINGAPTEKNGKGYISLLSEDGKIINQHWVDGLDAPKGMGISGSFLYVTNITEVVMIDRQKAEVVEHIPIEGAVFLNDISIDNDGVVYVSDMEQNKIHRIINGKAELYIDQIANANGLYAAKDALYVLSGQELLKIGKDKSIHKIATGIQGGGDGLEQLNEHTFLVSGWQGVLHLVNSTGEVKIILDTRILDSNTADIGFNKAKKMVYIPTFFKNKVVAYQIL